MDVCASDFNPSVTACEGSWLRLADAYAEPMPPGVAACTTCPHCAKLLIVQIAPNGTPRTPIHNVPYAQRVRMLTAKGG